MLKRSVSCVFCLVLIAAAASTAWPQGTPAGPPPSAAGWNSPSQPMPQQPVGQAQQGWTPPAPAYPPSQGAPAPQAGQAYPSYPYPPHHNPYYDGTPHPNFLSQWFDYMFNLPHTIAGTVADFMDRRVFPASPATRGNQSAAPVPQSVAPPGSQPSLPPATVYEQPRP